MRFKRRLAPTVNVNLIPMIDVVFQLVIFFMVSTVLINQPGISVIFPGSTTSEPVVTTKLMVKIASQREIYVNNRDQPYDLKGLEKAMAAISGEDKDQVKMVVIEGDRTISYDLMVKVLDILRKNGFKGVNLRTRQVESSGE